MVLGLSLALQMLLSVTKAHIGVIIVPCLVPAPLASKSSAFGNPRASYAHLSAGRYAKPNEVLILRNLRLPYT